MRRQLLLLGAQARREGRVRVRRPRRLRARRPRAGAERAPAAPRGRVRLAGAGSALHVELQQRAVRLSLAAIGRPAGPGIGRGSNPVRLARSFIMEVRVPHS